jgi:acyl-homoserine lactone synthase
MRSGARPATDGVLRAMFAARKSVFVDLLKWDVPVLEGAYEVDQFDDGHATYLILTDARGAHLGSRHRRRSRSCVRRQGTTCQQTRR